MSESNPPARSEEGVTGTADIAGTPHHPGSENTKSYSRAELNSHMHTLLDAHKVLGDPDIMHHLKPHMDAHAGLLHSVSGALAPSGDIQKSTKGSAPMAPSDKLTGLDKIKSKVSNRLSKMPSEDQ